MNTHNNGWDVDLIKFRAYLREKYKVEKAYYFLGAVNENNQSLYELIQSAGFIIVFREKQLALNLFGLNLYLINQNPILKYYHNDKRADENRLATPAPRTYFRLCAELRSEIKNFRLHGNSKKVMNLVGAEGLEPPTLSV